jgi:hypothetical protein
MRVFLSAHVIRFANLLTLHSQRFDNIISLWLLRLRERADDEVIPIWGMLAVWKASYARAQYHTASHLPQ